MTREEHLRFCKKCTNREMSMEGLICTLTGEKADFEETCKDFVRDESVKDEVPQDDRSTTEIIVNLKDDERNKLVPHQDLFYAIIGGLFSAIICALVWAAITVTTEYQIGFMAIGVGLAVGFAVRFFGAGIDQIYGIIGAFFALFGCVLGNLFSQVGFIAEYQQMGYLDVLLLIDLATIFSIFEESFSFMDLVFYAIAIGEGYKFAFRPVPENISQLDEAAPEYAKLRLPLVIGCFVLISGMLFLLSQGASGMQTFYHENGNIESQGNMEGGLMEGEWTYYYENERPYLSGNFVAGREEGPWIWYYESGEIMREGNYVNGLFDGAVKDYNPEGAMVVSSNYEAGRLTGTYKQFFANGQVQQEGTYVRDRQEGEWKIYFEDGTLNATLNLTDGMLSGISKIYYQDGSPMRVSRYEEDEIAEIISLWDRKGNQLIKEGNGRFVSYQDNGKVIEEGTVENGKRVGTWTFYHPSGRKLASCHFEGNELITDEAWNTSGEPMVVDGNGDYVTFYPDTAFEQEKGEIREGRRHGTWYLYYPNSIIMQMEQTYNNGKLHGPSIAYYQNGGLQSQGNFENDGKVGEWTWYYETGGVNTVVNYVDGEKEGDQFFYSELGEQVKVERYENGKLIAEEVL